MRQLAFHYRLAIGFSEPVQRHRFTLRCFPQTDARQRVTELRHFVSPQTFLSESRDSFGNLTLYGSADAPHLRFEADVCGTAAVGLAPCLPRGERSRERIFRYATPLTAPDEGILRLYRAQHADALGEYDACLALSEAAHSALVYTPGATGVRTTAAEALALGKGVCQDYAHLFLSLLRLRGIPARYVVGMLEGEGQSHAWAEAALPDGWYAFDPTNCLVVDDCHIRLSHGRDAADCSLNRGIFSGAAAQRQESSVIVQEE